MRFLTALGYHTEIKIGAGKPSQAGEVKSRTLTVNRREGVIAVVEDAAQAKSCALGHHDR